MAKAHVYLAPGANVETTDTFASWIGTTNQLVYDVGTVVVTTVGLTQPNSSVGGITSGNAHIEGIFSANTLSAASGLRGGTVSVPADLVITTNSVFNGTQNQFSNNTIIGSTPSSTVVFNSRVASSIIPTNNTIDLGSTSNTYGTVWATDVQAKNDVFVAGDLTVNGTTIFSSNVALSVNTSIINNLTAVNTLNLGGNARIISDVIPSANTTYSLGTTALRWNNIFANTITGALAGNATTATTLQTARTLNGVSFNGSANVVFTSNTTSTLTRGGYLTGVDFNGGTATTWAVDATNLATASKVVARDASGNFAANTINTSNVISTSASIGTLGVSGVTTANTINATSFVGPLTGNASTATTLQTARNINGVSFNGSANVVITSNTTAVLTNGAYLTGVDFNGGIATTWAVDAATGNVANKVVARDANGSLAANAVYTSTVTGDGAGLSNLNGSNIAFGTVADARIAATLVRTSATIATGDGLLGGGNLAANRTLSVDATVVRTAGNFSMSGALFCSAFRSTGTIVPTVTNSHNIGDPSARYANMFAGVFYGLASSANYADLAEKYQADTDYQPGTVIAVGGVAEVTAATEELAHSVLGVVSENPAFIMNDALETGTAIALKGRVPVKIIGEVKKGDRLTVSSLAGYATVNNSKDAWTFAIALSDTLVDGKVEAVIL